MVYGRILVCCVCLIAVTVIHGEIELELSVLGYDNPLGESYTGMNFTGRRKCCDTGGSDCTSGHDTCDVYFYFCIGSLNVDPNFPGCNGTSIDMSKNVSKDVFKLTERELGGRRFSNLTWWDVNTTHLTVNAIDIDVISTAAGPDPTMNTDLIDQFSQSLNFSPSSDYWSATEHLILLRNHISMAVRLRVWCSEGWYGTSCENKCIGNNFHKCSPAGLQQPRLECTNSDSYSVDLTKRIECRQKIKEADELVLPLVSPLSNINNLAVVQKHLEEFIASTVCPISTHSINITIDVIRFYSPSHTTVISHGYCDGNPISTMKFQQSIYVMNQIKLRLKSPQQLFGSSVTSPVFRSVSEANTNIAVFLLLRIIKYENLQSHGCALGNKGTFCNPVLSICFPPSSACTHMTVLKTSNLTDCNGAFVDLSDQKTTATSHKSIMLVSLKKMTNIVITVSEFAGNSVYLPLARHEFITDNLTVGSNFLDAYPSRYMDNKVNNTLISIEAMAWCSNCYHGDRCQQKTSSCNQAVTVLTPDCNVNADCQNKGACFNETCICPNGWIGPKCNVDVDECSFGVCKHVDTCTNAPGGYACTCLSGYNGTNCDQDIDECNTNPCHGGSVCLNTYGSYLCMCKNGTLGENCGGKDYCAMNPCYNNGTCIDIAISDSYVCNCLEGWTGNTCKNNVNECRNASLCQNGGVCHDTLGGFYCNCKSGFTGRFCKKDIDECDQSHCLNNATCMNTFGSYSCQCAIGWTGTTCGTDFNECNINPCQNSGICVNTGGHYSCNCLVGWVGENCALDRNECDLNPCFNDAICKNTQGSFTCDCPRGWQGEHCHVDIDECVTSYTCNLQGNCTNNDGGFTCRCFPGWSGINCSVDINECIIKQPCKNGGNCTNSDGSYSCTCPPNWTGKNCDSDVSECIHSPCQNGGTCHNTAGSYSCTCPKNWRGVNCTQDVNECAINNPCLNGGMCKNIAGAFACSCGHGWTGSKCEKDINECLIANPCQNGGSCLNTNGAYHCTCTSAWTGGNCSDNLNECSAYPNICQNGVCTDSLGNYVCTCVKGYTGKNCSDDINECQGSNPCENGGTCVNSIGNYQCQCPKAWTGSNCTEDVNECEKFDMCYHHGTCVNRIGSYECSCNEGWHGSKCNQDTDECLNNPCGNNVNRCMNTDGSFNCQCADGWQGHLCDENINDCVDVHCEHGKCQDLTNDYKCICETGYSGKNCEININDCESSPCKNGGLCHDQVGYYDCVCPPAWSGQTCDIDVDECRTRPCPKGQGCFNTPGSFICKPESFTAAQTMSVKTTLMPSTGGPTVVDIFSLQFTSDVAKGDRPQIRQGIQDILRLLTCHDSKNIYVSLVHNSVSNPKTVEFHAQCDGHHMTNKEVNTAIRTLSAEKLTSYFPVQLASLQSETEKQSWISSNIPIVAGGGGAAVLIVVVIGIICFVRRNKQKTSHNDSNTGLAIVEEMEDMDGKSTITIGNPLYNSFYNESTKA